MPAPCPQPRPVRTTELPTVDVEYHLEGTVCGRRMPLAVNVGYRAGSRQWAHALMELRKSVSVSVVEALPPLTTMFPPILDTEVTDPPLQWPAARRNRATSPNGSVSALPLDGDASVRGRGAVPSRGGAKHLVVADRCPLRRGEVHRVEGD